jgi:hypothetical protein
MIKRMTFATERAQTRLARIEAVLVGKFLLPAEIALAVHISKRWVYPYLNELHLVQNRIHIGDWRVNHNGGDYSPLYAGGQGEDVPKPAGKDWLTKAREARARVNADPDKRDVYLSRKRARGRVVKRDPLHAWIPTKPA